MSPHCLLKQKLNSIHRLKESVHTSHFLILQKCNSLFQNFSGSDIKFTFLSLHTSLFPSLNTYRVLSFLSSWASLILWVLKTINSLLQKILKVNFHLSQSVSKTSNLLTNLQLNSCVPLTWKVSSVPLWFKVTVLKDWSRWNLLFLPPTQKVAYCIIWYLFTFLVMGPISLLYTYFYHL